MSLPPARRVEARGSCRMCPVPWLCGTWVVLLLTGTALLAFDGRWLGLLLISHALLILLATLSGRQSARPNTA